jgi:hypothetical protein
VSEICRIQFVGHKFVQRVSVVSLNFRYEYATLLSTGNDSGYAYRVTFDGQDNSLNENLKSVHIAWR